MEISAYNEITKLLTQYCKDRDFLKTQNDLAVCVYASLNNSCLNDDNEIKMVENLCASLDGKTYEDLHIYGEKIHGTKSYVNFKMRSNSTRTELADMVLLSLITKGHDLVYVKVAFVQNKKETNVRNNWSIDANQLFLLQNFPTFTGCKGIFNNEPFKDKEIVFPNTTGSLGNYGLFKSDGEMIVAIASEISAKMIKNTIKYSSLAEDSSKYTAKNMIMPSLDIGEQVVVLCSGSYVSFKYPFLQNVSLSMNVCEFIRNFTQFNIGEPIVSPYASNDNDLLKLVNALIQNSSLKNRIGIKNIYDEPIGMDGNINILCTHLDLKAQ